LRRDALRSFDIQPTVGRPTRQDSASTIIVTFRITSGEKAQLEELARRRQTSISDVLRSLIRKEAARIDAARGEPGEK
jgi:predicted transcriptional regulator